MIRIHFINKSSIDIDVPLKWFLEQFNFNVDFLSINEKVVIQTKNITYIEEIK